MYENSQLSKHVLKGVAKYKPELLSTYSKQEKDLLLSL